VCPVAARAVVSRPAQTEAARPDVPAGFRREHPKAQYPARPSAAAARKVRALQATEEAAAMVAQRLAQAEQLVPPVLQAAAVAAVQQAQQVLPASAVQPTAAPGEGEVWDVAAVPQPAAESAGAEARRRGAAAVRGVAEAVQRRAAAPALVAVRLPGAVPDAAGAPLREVEVPDAAGVRRRVGRDAQAARLSAAAWAGLPSTRLQGDRPAPSARARSAHARGQLRIARP
jgi:hypothetical protein